MTADEKKHDSTLDFLAIVGWALPLAGFVWGPGEWWHYVIWLVVGTALIGLYDRFERGA